MTDNQIVREWSAGVTRLGVVSLAALLLIVLVALLATSVTRARKPGILLAATVATVICVGVVAGWLA